MGRPARLGSLALALMFAALLGPWLSGCADRGESRDARLDRLEARLDRLDERLTRTEARVPAAAGNGSTARAAEDRAGLDPDGVESLLGGMSPERRERIRKRIRDMRRRMQQLSEGADVNAEPGTPEFRRGLLLEMLRQQSPMGGVRRQRDADTEGDERDASPEDADGEDTATSDTSEE